MPYSKNDAYMYFYESNSSSIMRGNGTNNAPTIATSETELYTFDSLTRVFFNSDENWPSSGVQRYTSTGCVYLPLARFTQPINTVLYNYINNGLSTNVTMDNYVNPTNDFNRTALRQLTSNACTKLKESGARIYVIKYKAQENWGALTRTPTTEYENEQKPHDYTEIDACATNTGGKLYSISTESDLKNALAEIAADIKTLANYKPAEATY